MEKFNTFSSNFDLTNRVALVTGAGGLLGFEHSYALLEVGANVILTDNRIDILEETANALSKIFDANKITIKKLDVTDKKIIQTVNSELITEGKTVDILINNASVNPQIDACGKIKNSDRFENFALNEWNNHLNVGLTGAFLCSQVFGTQMVKTKTKGVILNIASDLSVIAPDQRIYKKNFVEDNHQPVKPVTYSVAKTGLIGLTRYLSTYWADKDIRCNAISPGGVFNGQDKDFVGKVSSLIPLGRMAQKSEYRGAIQFLCCDASSYLTGQNIVVDGGRSVW